MSQRDCAELTAACLEATGVGWSAVVGILLSFPHVHPVRRDPAAIAIPSMNNVEAPVEVRTIERGTMLDPTGPEVVAWSDDSARLGERSNAVFAGHVDFAGYGPAVFARPDELDDGGVIRVEVVWVRTYPVRGEHWGRLTAPAKRESLTLVTCTGAWDDDLGHDAARQVVRAVRIKG